jgi:hypothetical protein
MKIFKKYSALIIVNICFEGINANQQLRELAILHH